MARTEILTQAEKEFLKMSLDVVLRAKGMEMIDFVKICKDKLEALPEFVDVPDPVPVVPPSSELPLAKLLSMSRHIQISGSTISIKIQEKWWETLEENDNGGLPVLFLYIFKLLLESEKVEGDAESPRNVRTLAFVEEAIRSELGSTSKTKKTDRLGKARDLPVGTA